MKQENDHLKQEVKNLQTTLNHIGAYVFIKDIDGKYTYVNDMVCELFDSSSETIIGFDDTKFFDFEYSNDLKKNDQKVLLDGITVEEEEKNIISKTGEVKYFQTVKKPLRDNDENIIGMFGVSTDITERKLMEIELKKKQELLDTVLNNVDAFIYMKDTDFRFLYLNQKTADLFEKEPYEVIGKKGEEFLSLEAIEDFKKSDENVFKTNEEQRIEETFIDADGIPHHYWSVKIPLKDENGLANSYIGISTDITQLSLMDPLTGLKNRRSLDIEIDKTFALYKRYKKEYCVIMADVDYFKNINDTYGHLEGDKVLQHISKLLENNLRSTDIIGRWGGEEFLLITPSTSKENAMMLAEKLRQTVQTSYKDYKLSMSFGIAQAHEDNQNPYDIIKCADTALYKAKDSGRNKVIAFSQ